MNLAIFVSGSGSNMMAILNAIESGTIQAKVKLVVSSSKNAAALEKASNRGISTLVLNPKRGISSEIYTKQLLDALSQKKVDGIILAGYLKLIPAKLVRKYRNRILNIHPSLLPSFGGKGYYGSKVHEAVLKRGVRWTGVTIHLVSDEYDEGPIVLQEPVEVLADDDIASLASRVLKTEHKLYPQAVALFADRRIEVKDGKVHIKP